jgi:1-phosphofructokinase family hexose kinase
MIYTLTLNPAVDLEYTVQALNVNEVLRAPAARKDFGGKGFNVSRMLRVLGVESTALGFIGGRNGSMLEEGLRSLGIATDFVWTAGETRANVSIVGRQAGDYIKVNEPGPTISLEEKLALLKKVGQLAAPGDLWVLAGSLPPGIPKSIYADLTRIIQGAGARVVLDTSGEALESGLDAGPYLIKPNAVEAANLTGRPVDSPAFIAESAREIIGRGATQVVISLGDEGALFATSNLLLLGHPPIIKEQNPIGAGDAMVAGLVYRFSISTALDDALQWGLACGAAAASQPGTHMGTRALIEQFIPETRIEEIQYGS